ncbi:MAG: hypothetical protein WCK81_11570, partial [Betaproteobacteria bacterium]
TVGSETVTASAVGTFDSANAGSRTATAAYSLADGTGLASNYSLSDTTHKATIAPVTVPPTLSSETAGSKGVTVTAPVLSSAGAADARALSDNLAAFYQHSVAVFGSGFDAAVSSVGTVSSGAPRMASTGSAVEYASAATALAFVQTMGFSGGEGTQVAPASNAESGVRITIVNLPTDEIPGLLEVAVPRGTAGSDAVLVIALPDAVVASARTRGATVQVTGRDDQPLPNWIRYELEKKALVLNAVPADALPLSLRLTVGEQTTVIALAEN